MKQTRDRWNGSRYCICIQGWNTLCRRVLSTAIAIVILALMTGCGTTLHFSRTDSSATRLQFDSDVKSVSESIQDIRMEKARSSYSTVREYTKKPDSGFGSGGIVGNMQESFSMLLGAGAAKSKSSGSYTKDEIRKFIQGMAERGWALRDKKSKTTFSIRK